MSPLSSVHNMSDAPVIVFGMHRSGTTMFAEALDRLGLFLGRRLDGNHEALYFLRLNEELYRRCGATWDHPQPVARFFEYPDAVELSRRCIESDLRSRNFRTFIGWTRGLLRGGVDKLRAPWGFKDPRTAFTLPLWLRVFPRARLVYVIRNGIDVAHSLVAREERLLSDQVRVFDRRFARRAPEKHVRRQAYKGSVRCLTFEGAFSLWEEYVARAETTLANVRHDFLRVRYEDVVASPRQPIADLADVCGLSAFTTTTFDEVLSAIDSTRGARGRATHEFADQIVRALDSPWMRRLGYGCLPRGTPHTTRSGNVH